MGSSGAELTLRQERLVQAMLDPTTKSVAAAAKKAGYGHRETGSKMLRNPTVRGEIQRRIARAADKAKEVQHRGLDGMLVRVQDPDATMLELAAATKTATDVLEKVDDSATEATAAHPPEFYRSIIRRGLCRLIPHSLRPHMRNTWRNGELRWQLLDAASGSVAR